MRRWPSRSAIVRTRSDGFPVVSVGNSTTVLIYVGNTPYNIEITDDFDVPIFPAKDVVKGAVDTSIFLTAGSTSVLVKPVLTKTAKLHADGCRQGQSHRRYRQRRFPTTSVIQITDRVSAAPGSPVAGDRYIVRQFRESRAACATFVAWEMLPTLLGGTLVRRRMLGEGRIPEWEVAWVEGIGAKLVERRSARARWAASMWLDRASSPRTRFNSLLTRFFADAKICLRCSGFSTVPAKLPPRGSALLRNSRCRCRAKVLSLSRISRKRTRTVRSWAGVSS
jgi:hypothetical protein